MPTQILRDAIREACEIALQETFRILGITDAPVDIFHDRLIDHAYRSVLKRMNEEGESCA